MFDAPMARTRPRKTKIVATIGPACGDPVSLRRMISEGMDVARLNLSHGNLESHAEQVRMIREAADAEGANVAIMADLRGCEIRTGVLADGEITLNTGQNVVLHNENCSGRNGDVSISYANLHAEVAPGDRVLLDDGEIELRVVDVEEKTVRCVVEQGGALGNNKGVNLPDNSGLFRGLESHKSEDIEFAATQGVQYVAVPFVQCAADVDLVRTEFASFGADIPIIAKIENHSGVENLKEIVDAADGTMVARGDLGVELGVARGPAVQKKIIRMTVTNGKPVITATQMLDSMERNPRPTRAEVSDVANAILDGTSAVMLSGETAVGAYPIETVRTMVELSLEAEAGLAEFGCLQRILPNASNVVTEAVAQASITMASHLQADAVIALTETGFTARLISKYRPDCPIVAVSSSDAVVRRLAMNWGVRALQCEAGASDEDRIQFATRRAKEFGYLKSQSIVVITAGSHRRAGSTDLIRILTVD